MGICKKQTDKLVVKFMVAPSEKSGDQQSQ